MRQRKRTHSRGPEGLAEPAEGGRHLRHGERHPVRPHGEAALSETEFARQLERFPVCQLESLPTSRYLLAPKALLQIDARQLSGYGGSLETAVTDLTHYLTGGCRVMVLCGGQVPGQKSAGAAGGPEDRRCWIWRGSAPQCGTWYSLRWVLCPPDASTRPLQLAVLTEGQLTTPLAGKAKKARPKRDSNQQRLQSYAEPEPPAIWWCISTMASVASWG